jgi:SpoVK/Ycf46/Vps4 family AAA+-type ATPase
MQLCCHCVPLATDVDFEEFADQTEGLTGADIESLCKKATLLAIVEFQDSTRGAPFVVSRSDFQAVLNSGLSSSEPQKATVLRNSSGDLQPGISTTPTKR